jgi:mannose-6-phosphate isomerase-like protein (cupin superfamily)
MNINSNGMVSMWSQERCWCVCGKTIKDLVDETTLRAGDFTQVKPGKTHQFEGVETGVAFELYWAEFNHNDIVRRTVGSKT